MEFRKPLTEIGGWQVQRPRSRRKTDKVYGKATSKFRAGTGPNIFADENDEYEIVDRLGGMKLKHSPLAKHTEQSEDEYGGVVLKSYDKGKERVKPSEANLPEPESGRPSRWHLSTAATKPKREQLSIERKQDAPPDGSTRNQLADVKAGIKKEHSSHVEPICNEAVGKATCELQTFEYFAQNISKSYKITKLAEGSYGDCYKGIVSKSPSTDPGESEIILKIIPLLAASSPADAEGSSVTQIIHEIKILKIMDNCHGFVRFRDVYVLQGMYPELFLKLFREWKASHPLIALNKDPAERFSKQQQFAVFGMSHAGTDLESLLQPSAFQIFDIFWSLVMLMTKAEQDKRFEHRDLHTGNVCYKPRLPGGRTDINQEFNATMTEPPDIKLGLASLRLTIIDYTLSRARLDERTDETAYSSMLGFDFDSTGRTEEERQQRTVYRRMNNCIKKAESELEVEQSEESIHPWSRFVPRTNVCWLIYLLQTLCARSKGRILGGSSTVSKKLQEKMFKQFAEILKRFRECAVGRLPNGASDLLEVGLEQVWLYQEDIEAFRAYLETSGA